MNKILLSLVAFFTFSLSIAQDLPKYLTEDEKAMMPAYIQQAKLGNITTPPSSPVRAMAEWEELDGLLVTWTSYTTIIREIVKYARQETQVYIVCADSNAVKSNLTSNSIPLSNIHYLVAPFNSVWSRDYGQWNVYTNDIDSLLIVDWIYNRPRPKDDTIPKVLADHLNLPFYEMTTPPYDLIHTGGNYMVDGFGTAFSSNLVVDENPTKSIADIDTIMKHFMGIDRYIKMTVLPYDDIHHIDMHLKLLDEETLLVGEFPAGVSDGPQIEANLLYILNNFNSVYGTPYKIVRIPMPPSTAGAYAPNTSYRTYANSVFINKTILVPTYYPQYDTTAIRIYKEALPGYNVIGINANGMISAGGALHCITKEIGAADPLLISHKALPNTFDVINPYQVDARIQHRSGISTAGIYYRTDTLQPYQPAAMSLTNVQDNIWTAYIPAQPVGSVVYYYVEANSNSGKAQVRPLPAPAGFWKFEVLPIVSMNEIGLMEFKPVFPNPSKGITAIPVSSNKATELKITLNDLLGRKVKDIFEGTVPVGDSYYFINTTDTSSGVYLIKFESESNMQTQKLVVR